MRLKSKGSFSKARAKPGRWSSSVFFKSAFKCFRYCDLQRAKPQSGFGKEQNARDEIHENSLGKIKAIITYPNQRINV